MRSALLGVCADSNSHLSDLVRASTRVTHTDPKAEEGALLVARAARITAVGSRTEPIAFLDQAASEIAGEELRGNIEAAVAGLREAQSPFAFAESQGWSDGISGYINRTVPAALYCWANSPTNFRQCVENAVLLGGDSDSVAAITGAVCGANLGNDKIPPEWIARLSEWPRTTNWMNRLAEAVAEASKANNSRTPPPMYWLATIPRNVIFAAIVLGLGLRRLLPPY
jgi:ADP-ribosylglycohydrolase